MTESYLKIIQSFVASLKGLRLYPAQHPAVQRQLGALLEGLEGLFSARSVLRIGNVDGSLFFEDHLFVDPSAVTEEMSHLLSERKIERIEFSRGVDLEELRQFTQIFVQQRADSDVAAPVLNHIRVIRTETTTVAEKESPREVYGRALQVMDNIFQDVRLGAIPSTVEIIGVVESMAKLTIEDPSALFALSMLKDYDNYTFTHSVNVGVLALAVGRACRVSEEELRLLGMGGLLHDLGKLKIDIGIITKPGKLTDLEFGKIMEHPAEGAAIVQAMAQVPAEVIDIVLGHHLHYDRQGYPSAARDRKMSRLVDMTAIADTYDALTTLRSYQRPLTQREAVKRLRELKSTIFHPEYTEMFTTSLGRFPVGTLVRLDDNTIGLVMKVGEKDPNAVNLKLLIDAQGVKYTDNRLLNLAGAESRRVVGEVEPFIVGIDVSEHL
ncbi:MAG: HD domain-containing protein [Desulfuromonadales bacterium]|nr:HD domain-containing protein [Desulfuromonadales bacterium]MDT8423670.1 HD domain-containing protein [Desulfuromonadales bacterium]